MIELHGQDVVGARLYLHQLCLSCLDDHQIIDTSVYDSRAGLLPRIPPRLFEPRLSGSHGVRHQALGRLGERDGVCGGGNPLAAGEGHALAVDDAMCVDSLDDRRGGGLVRLLMATEATGRSVSLGVMLG